MALERAPAIDGILLLDKPAGISSSAAVQRIKRLFGARKAGHTGSLDPLASGMLPICLGEATKVAGALLSARKHYRFTIRLGVRTSTGDAEGTIVETLAVPALPLERATATIARFVGTREQVPPMHSALKHRGEPLYRLARRGIAIERPPRTITIHDLELIDLSPPHMTLAATCSKGTYIRSLVEEIAAAAGTCGHVVALRRLWVEPFQEQTLQSLDALDASEPRTRVACLLPIDWALRDWARVDLDAEQARRLMQGQCVTLASRPAPALQLRAYGPGERFLGIVERDEDGRLSPRRLITVEPRGL